MENVHHLPFLFHMDQVRPRFYYYPPIVILEILGSKKMYNARQILIKMHTTFRSIATTIFFVLQRMSSEPDRTARKNCNR